MIDAQRLGATSDAVAVLAAALLLAIAMLFGGGPQGAGDALVHIAAIPVLALGLARWRWVDGSRLQRWFACWLLAVVVLFALQLLPLPASVFARLPQRASVLADLRAAGVDRTWLPMTLDTWATVRGALAVLAFGGMWLLASTLPLAMRVRLLQLALVVATLTALLGFAQAAAGQHAPVRFHDYHHPVGAIGTFANRNHFASLMAMLLPVAVWLAVRAQRSGSWSAAGWYFVGVVLLLASALSYSRAGFALTLVALVAVAVLFFRSGAGRRGAGIPAVVAVLAIAAIGYYAWDGLMNRLEQDPLADLRWQYLEFGWTTALAYLPWGSGFGSFPFAYAPFEPVSSMTSVYAARAHNDALQVLIEGGIAGAFLAFALIGTVFAGCMRKIPMGANGVTFDHHIRVVMFIAICVPLLHSLVDYPLRTLCVSTVLALLLSILLGDGEREVRAR